MNTPCVNIGLDIGSVNVRCVASTDARFTFTPETFQTINLESQTWIAKSVELMGQPIKRAHQLLYSVLQACPDNAILKLSVTGSQSKQVARLLGAPIINEFKSIARGTVQSVPKARTILEIGGDGSRYIKVNFDADVEKLTILDYQRNGECAAGTGSFIDQQAQRLNLEVADIGELVRQADGAATIAGRCSVFAKSDMIHAQQRGLSPAAIFKGLCEAVVRNYKGTVLRGKHLEPLVVFVGGVASNSGVVDALKSVLALEPDHFVVPENHAYVSAIGCALVHEEKEISTDALTRLNQEQAIPPAVFSESKLDRRRVRKEEPRDIFAGKAISEAYLGLDVGSVSTNLVLITEEGDVLDSVYTSTSGQPIEVVLRELAAWSKRWGHLNILAVGSTGSGRELIGELVGADAVHDEITAHKTGATAVAAQRDETVDTIFEIGGQDSKFISIDRDVVVDFAMNEACAAGTGSFLEEQANKLGISIKNDFARLALASEHPIRLGERCTVFMEKDVTLFLQQGRKIKDITAGLAFAVVQNYLNRVVRGRSIGERIYFQGGTAYNLAVAAAFATVLDKEIIIPPHNGVIGAIGAALLAKEKFERHNVKSRFRGFDLSHLEFSVRSFVCKACSNQCDIQEFTIEGEKSYWGDKCSERYRKKRKVPQKAVIPDLLDYYQSLLLLDIPAPNGSGIKIGIPRSMYFFDRFPFWRTYFSYLGAEIVISSETTNKIAAKGRELCVAEPCFPIVVGHGHFVDLLKQNVDAIFMPQIINSETDTPETYSWLCPWGQTLPLVIRNSLDDSVYVDKLLMPVIHFRDEIDYVKKEIYPVARKLGVSRKQNDKAVEAAYQAQHRFTRQIEEMGRHVLQLLEKHSQPAVVLVGRPYNIYDNGVNLHVPDKLRELYGINVIPMDFLPFRGIDVKSYHENMFWNYGRKILQAARYVGGTDRLELIYFTNFKCGPDSYIKHFVRDAVGGPYLTLQFDDHSNDAGIMTRCEAFLESVGFLRHPVIDVQTVT